MDNKIVVSFSKEELERIEKIKSTKKLQRTSYSFLATRKRMWQRFLGECTIIIEEEKTNE